MLNLKALLIVHGSKNTDSLLLGFLTKTKLWTQSVASLIWSLQITSNFSILFISAFSGSSMLCGILWSLYYQFYLWINIKMHLNIFHSSNSLKQVIEQLQNMCFGVIGIYLDVDIHRRKFWFSCMVLSGTLSPTGNSSFTVAISNLIVLQWHLSSYSTYINLNS